jgi:hypothetical protein
MVDSSRVRGERFRGSGQVASRLLSSMARRPIGTAGSVEHRRPRPARARSAGGAPGTVPFLRTAICEACYSIRALGPERDGSRAKSDAHARRRSSSQSPASSTKVVTNHDFWGTKSNQRRPASQADRRRRSSGSVFSARNWPVPAEVRSSRASRTAWGARSAGTLESAACPDTPTRRRRTRSSARARYRADRVLWHEDSA